MENVIYFFSGTGNSYSFARDFADALGDTELINIADLMGQTEIEVDYERVGFIFPVYYGGVPVMVRDFVKKLSFIDNPYLFTVVTCGLRAGSAIDELGELIASKKEKLFGAFCVNMPGNYIAAYGSMPDFIRYSEINKAKTKAFEYAGSVSSKLVNYNRPDHEKPIVPLIERMPDYHYFATDYKVSDKCTACELCVKICPSANITINDGKAYFGSHCERCMACIQWCPFHAVSYKDKTDKRRRYHHPAVKAEELFR
jgi:ferredoxin/flavodoxin